MAIKRHKCPHKISSQPEPPTIKPTIKTKRKQKSLVDTLLEQGYLKSNDIKLIKAVADDIVQWAVKTKKAKSLERYYVEKGFTHTTITDWRKKYEFLDEAIEFAKMAIGVRLEDGIIDNKYNTHAAKTLHNYLDRCKGDDEWHANLKQSDLKAALTAIPYLLEKFPDSKLVPTKKDDDE